MSIFKSQREAISSVLKDVLKDSPSGEQATAQAGPSIDHPHHHAGQTSGEKHVDGYVGTKMPDGSVKVEKIHSDD